MPNRSKPRPRSPLEYEERLRGRGCTWIAGADEVGRGPLAGPVVAAAVVLPPGVWVKGAGDSKGLSALRRITLAREIRRVAAGVGVGAASVQVIDVLGIARATAMAVERAVSALPSPPDHLILDGRPMRHLAVDVEHEAVVGGDATVHCVGCASIVAKVLRDHLMAQLAQRYPGYGWETNAGYGTERHMKALRDLGVTPHHRRSFAPVRARLEM